MTEKRFYCDSIGEYRDYGIFDLTQSDKTLNDFWNEEEECYERWRFTNYLTDETDAMMKSDEVLDYLNKLHEENIELKEELQKWRFNYNALQCFQL